MSRLSKGGQPTGSYRPESVEEACRAIVYHLSKGMSDGKLLGAEEIALMLADYSARARDLSPTLRTSLDRAVIDLFSPGRDLNEEPALNRMDVGILTILAEELDAANLAFDIDPENFELPGRGTRRFYSTEVVAQRARRSLSVVVTNSIRPLNAEVGQAVAELREYYHPEIMFLVGIAGGHRDHLHLGDVVVPEWVHYYEPGRVTDSGVQDRHPPVEVSYDLYNNLRYYRLTERYSAMVEGFLKQLSNQQKPARMNSGFQPRVVMNNIVIGSGEKVVRSQQFMDELYRENALIKAVDQESYGFGASNRGYRWAIVRGISDHGTGQEEESTDEWKVVATGFAALFLRDFLEREYMPPPEGRG